jgi:hypothetical protein
MVNRDDDSHELVSGNAEHGRPDGILNTGIIESCKSISKKFEINNTTSILYFCLRHPEESGAIVIYSKKYEEQKMTMKKNYLFKNPNNHRY